MVVEKTINFEGKPIPMAGTTQDSVVNENAYEDNNGMTEGQNKRGEDR